MHPARLMCLRAVSWLTGDLNRYSLIAPLGPPGGYGSAYSALRDDGLPCVVKLIHGFQNPQPDQLDRLEVMLARLAQVRSAHVVRIIDAGIDQTLVGRLPWLAMPEISGARSLRQVMRESGGPLGVEAAHRIGRGIVQGLADLHAVGALHRDLKPENILIDADGRAWLIDFELIKIHDLATRTPKAHEPLGTEVYMAPEQLVGPVVPATDLWALGLVVAELLTGQQPVIAAARRSDVRRAILTGRLVPDALPEHWDDLINALLRKVPVARPESATAVIDWFDRPGSSLGPPAITGAPGMRWALHTDDDVDAAEVASRVGARIHALDLRGAAVRYARRAMSAAEALEASLSLERPRPAVGQLTLGGQHAADADDAEQLVIASLEAQAQSPTETVLLPWEPLDRLGVDGLVHLIRLGVRHRGLVGDRPVIATVECSAGALTAPGRAIELAAALTALRPDGWRLLVDGLQPGCKQPCLDATAEMASALACCADVWVRASGVARWVPATIPGTSVLYRSGRGLWTRPSGGGGITTPERVEIAALAGPVPRDVAERLQLAAPELLDCYCPVCDRLEGGLPTPGSATIVHNVFVVDGQLAALRQLEPARRIADAVLRLEGAIERRADLPELVGWHGELDDVRDVLAVLEGRASQRRRAFEILRHA
jgi:protein kinase-like protein